MMCLLTGARVGAVVGVRSRRRSCERRSSAFSFPLDRVPSNSLATRKNIMARLLILVTALLASAVSAFSCSQPALVAMQRPAASSVVVGDVLRVSPEAIVMAVPKKRQSKMKTRQRKANVRAPPQHAHSPRTHTRNLVR